MTAPCSLVLPFEAAAQPPSDLQASAYPLQWAPVTLRGTDPPSAVADGGRPAKVNRRTIAPSSIGAQFNRVIGHEIWIAAGVSTVGGRRPSVPDRHDIDQRSNHHLCEDLRHFTEKFTRCGTLVRFYNRGSGRLDFAADGTFTKASPSSTTSSATLQMQVSRARWRSGMSSATSTVTSTVSPIRTGARKLSVCEM